MRPPELLLLLLFTAALFAGTTTAAFEPCPNCGSTVVPYPLSTSPTCGDQSYKIRCDAASTSLVFDTLNNSYPITGVSAATQRLVIAPSPLLPNACVTADISRQGVQLNESLPFNVTSSNTILYLNCSETLLRSPLNCSAASLCHSYVNDTGGACGDAPICCTFRAGGSSTSYMIRVRDSGCSAYTSFVGLDPGLPVDRWPDPGVEIQWVSPMEPVCGTQEDCDGEEGWRGRSTCGPDPTAPTRRCFCNAGLVWDPIAALCAENVTCQDPDGCDDSKRTALIAGLTSGIGGILAASAVAGLLYRRHRRIKEARARLAKEREEILNSGGGATAKVFTGREIKRATGNFSPDRLLGAGGYGEVYKGFLNDGTAVAIKCAKLGNSKGVEQILNEVRILCQLNHRSLVRLLGCCVELDCPVLVYEYVDNGTLFDHLRDPKARLSWTTRLRIARDAAEGLTYLHFSAVPAIYHRDVKSSNILLDKKMWAKVSDFGLSRLAHADLSHVSTCAQGTLGYLDPEYYRNYQLTDKSDVYSFGVVLLELITGQKAIDFGRESDDVNLAVYAQRMAAEERLMEMVETSLKEGASQLEKDTIKALAFLALGCLEERRQNRPSMKEVLEEIDYILSIAQAKVLV